MAEFPIVGAALAFMGFAMGLAARQRRVEALEREIRDIRCACELMLENLKKEQSGGKT